MDRCRGLEIRSAALYRSFAAGARDRPDLSAFWTAMAREEKEHARILDDARTSADDRSLADADLAEVARGRVRD